MGFHEDFNETQESKFHMKILEMTLGFCTLNGP
jgi:hypothetical protein